MQGTDSLTVTEVKGVLCLWWVDTSMRSLCEDGQSSTLLPMYGVLKHYPNTARSHRHRAIIEV